MDSDYHAALYHCFWLTYFHTGNHTCRAQDILLLINFLGLFNFIQEVSNLSCIFSPPPFFDETTNLHSRNERQPGCLTSPGIWFKTVLQPHLNCTPTSGHRIYKSWSLITFSLGKNSPERFPYWDGKNSRSGTLSSYWVTCLDKIWCPPSRYTRAGRTAWCCPPTVPTIVLGVCSRRWKGKAWQYLFVCQI